MNIAQDLVFFSSNCNIDECSIALLTSLLCADTVPSVASSLPASASAAKEPFWCGELKIVASFSIASDFECNIAPCSIVVVSWTCQSMSNFMQQCVSQLYQRSACNQVAWKAECFCLKVTSSSMCTTAIVFDLPRLCCRSVPVHFLCYQIVEIAPSLC